MSYCSFAQRVLNSPNIMVTTLFGCYMAGATSKPRRTSHPIQHAPVYSVILCEEHTSDARVFSCKPATCTFADRDMVAVATETWL